VVIYIVALLLIKSTMKNTYITVIVLVVLVLGAVLIFGSGKKVEAPVLPAEAGQNANLRLARELPL